MARKPLLPGSMTARQFAKAAKQTSASVKETDRAHRVLVDGETVLAVANSVGMSTGAIYAVVYRFYSPPSRNERFWPMLAPPPPKR